MEKVYSAPLIFTNNGEVLKNGFIKTDAEGRILAVSSSSENENVIHHDGVIIPGFINSHCHLELSHLKSQITERTNGMTGFIKQLLSKRFDANEARQAAAMMDADQKMYKEGIVAVGDISNTLASLNVKRQSKIYYHTFVEILGTNSQNANSIIENGKQLVNDFNNQQQISSLTPHAPYSVSKKLLKLINEDNKITKQPSTIHLQESLDEIEYCKNSSGPMAEFFETLGITAGLFDNLSEEKPIYDTLKQLNNCKPLQLVHNTFTTIEEVTFATANYKSLFWCLCVNANQFITGELPNLSIFNNPILNVTVGTDSLASNHQLSILSELKTIHQYAPEISFETMVKWATINGAKFLGIDDKFGEIKGGKKPGLLLLESINIEKPHFTNNVTSKRII